MFSSGNYARSVSYNIYQKIWVAGGGSATNTMAYSSDGFNWTGLGLQAMTGSVLGIANNETVWVAGGYANNTLAYSKDGITWTGRGTTIFSSYAYGFAYNISNNLWIATGNGTANSIAYSNDGFNWTGLGLVMTYTNDVAFSDKQNLWVSGGNGTNSLAYSKNGINWTGITLKTLYSECFCVAYDTGSDLWISGGGGTNSLAYSKDGTNWTGITAKTIFSTYPLHVTYSTYQNLWTAVGQGTNTIAYSKDGFNWTGRGLTTFDSRGYGIACNDVVLPPPIMYYPFDTNYSNYATGTAVADSINSNSTLVTTGQKVGTGCLKVNGSTVQNYLKTGSLSFTSSGFSITFWYNSSDTTTDTPQYNTVFSTDINAAYDVNSFVIATMPSLGIRSSIPSSAWMTSYNTGIAVNDGVWRHIGLSVTYGTLSSSTYNFYINGVLAATTTGYYPTAGTRTYNYIGNAVWSMGIPNFGCDCSVDDFKIFYRPLGAYQMNIIYNQV